MNRITTCFENLKSKGRKALIPYIAAGDPSPEYTVALMQACVEAGGDIIELGIPFSDPMADGPVIQRASERALAHGVGLGDVLKLVAQFRQQDQQTPVVLMGYLNPIEVMGYEQFARAAAEAGVDGVLTVDVPPEEGHDLLVQLNAQQLAPIFLLAPTTQDQRIATICKNASGYVYYVSLKGVTGAASLNVDSVAEKVTQIRKHSRLPVGVGFGIKDAQAAAAVSQCADAVVVGSAIIEKVEQNLDKPENIAQEIGQLLSSMRQAMDAS